MRVQRQSGGKKRQTDEGGVWLRYEGNVNAPQLFKAAVCWHRRFITKRLVDKFVFRD